MKETNPSLASENMTIFECFQAPWRGFGLSPRPLIIFAHVGNKQLRRRAIITLTRGTLITLFFAPYSPFVNPPIANGFRNRTYMLVPDYERSPMTTYGEETKLNPFTIHYIS